MTPRSSVLLARAQTGSMIHLHTLGDALITIGDREIRPTSPMVFAALLYLALERGHRVPRSALQELLFPEADERSGAHSMRQLLYKLRQLGAPIDADARSVSLRVEDVHDDVGAEVAITNGSLSGLERCAHGLLADYTPGISREYGAWLEQKRETMLAEVRRKLVAAMCASREAVNWPAVERLAHVILEVDPFNEEATLALAEATALTGAKARALGILTRYESETGRTDLRLPPAVLRRRISESLPKIARRRPTPFVGRETDAEILRGQVLRARIGKSTLAVIAGEAGIGKTRLVEEAASLAALDGTQVHVVRCQSHYAARPLGVFIELVPALLTSRGALGISPQSLAHLKLLISHRDDDRDRPVDARDDMTRSAILRSALRDLADAVAAETPLLIVVEDAHHADQDSLRELSGLTQTTADRALLVIYTTRYLEPLKQSAVLHEGAVVRRLKPLGQPAMENLARHLLPGGSVDTEAGTWCVRTAAGNPLFLEMLCARYAETGAPYSVPPDLVSAITRRIELLPRECAQVLEFCALLGRHATIEALRTLMAVDSRELLGAVRRLEEEGYLQLRDDAARISHDLLTECTLNLIPPVSRKVLHGCVAANLEQRFEATNEAALLWDCAEQWVLSGDAGKAIQLIRRCARHATTIGKASEALELLSHARELVRYPSDTKDVIVDMMFAARSASNWHLVLELSEELRLTPSGDGDRNPHSDLELLGLEAQWMDKMERNCVEPLVRCIESTESPRNHRVDAAFLLLKVAHEIGEPSLARRAFCGVEHLLDPSSKVHSNRIVPIIYHVSFGDMREGLRLARKLRSHLTSMQSLNDELRSASNVTLALKFLGEIDEACEVAKEYYLKSDSLGLAVWRSVFCSAICGAYSLLERFAEMDEWYLRLDTDSDCTSSTPAAISFHSHGFELALWKRDRELAQFKLSALIETGAGDGVRGNAYLRAAETRLRQMDPDYKCSVAEIEGLSTIYARAKSLITLDLLPLALGEALRRNGDAMAAANMLDEYAMLWRRELTPLPPSLRKLRQLCDYSSSIRRTEYTQHDTRSDGAGPTSTAPSTLQH